MPELLDGRAALTTGTGGGVGGATVLARAREGARVAVADVAADAARETIAQVNAAGGRAISLSGDVTRDADVRGMIAGVVGTVRRAGDDLSDDRGGSEYTRSHPRSPPV